MWFKFSLRSLFIATALVGSFLAGKLSPAKALREAEIERDVARDRLTRFQEQLKDSVGGNGCYVIPPRGFPMAVVALDEQFITIAAGTDDGLREGHLLDVRRGVLAVASVRIVRASADRSLVVYCRPIDAGRISEGDFAYLR